MSPDHPFSPRRFLGLSALCVALAGCSGGSGAWPGLAIPATTPGPPPAPAIRAAPASAALRHGAPTLSREEAAALIAALPQTLADFSRRIAQQKQAYQAARERARASGLDLDRRSAEFELSRLSRIETALATLLRKFERLPAGLSAAGAAQEAVRRLTDMHGALVAYLAAERRRLAGPPAP